MGENRFRLKRRVYVVGLLMIAAVGGGWFWADRRHEEIARGALLPQPFVRVGAGGQPEVARALGERAEFFDPAPLFVPTEKNFGRGQLPARLTKQPGEVFGDFEPKLNFGNAALGTYGAESLAAGEGMVEVLSRSNEVPFAGLGEMTSSREKLPARSAVVRIARLGESGSREIVLTGIGLPRADFAPLEFMLAVGPSGLIGAPSLAAGSGREEVDGFFQEFLASASQVGSVLPPGRYRVTIGP
jgi:hypothetical protein